MKRRDALLALFAAAAIVMALLTVFAIELSDTQAKSKQDVKARVHERAVLAAALIDSLFHSVQQELPQYTRTYGTRTVSDRMLNQQRSLSGSQGGYLALLDQAGHVLASSRSFTAQARADLHRSAALALLREGRPYGLGDLLPYGRSGVVNFGVSFPTRYGTRTLLTGLTPVLLSTFFGAELHRIPGVKGAYNYLLDANNAVLGSTNPAVRVGDVISRPGALRALQNTSGEVDGQYFDQVSLTNSTWRIVLAAPDGQLFASVSGLRKWVPWAIFVAFALVALSALLLGRRALRATAQVRDANAQLELVNGELAEANATLNLRATELERSNAELEQFASIASHDLQEPLRKVRTFTQQLTVMEAAHLSPKGHDYLQRTNAAAARMQKLIEDLLRFSRLATHGRPFEPVDLDHVTREALIDLSDQLERSGAVIALGELPSVMGDRLQLQQLMQNLISNGLKFRREGVTPEIVVDAKIGDRAVVLTVRDNGIGFEPQYSWRIFRVFERLHGRSAYPGTGIGLALCRKIVERHGGDIVADGVPGEGATFTVTLPVAGCEDVISLHSASPAGQEQEEAHAAV